MMLFGRLLILLLSVLPKHAMSRVAGRLANRPLPLKLRVPVLRGFSRIFGAVPEEAELPLAEYGSINAFFTRQLKPGLRPIAAKAIVSPVDAAVGAYGPVADDVLVQAKGRNYSLAALLGHSELAHAMDGGTFATLYLAPRDYHRIHVPVDGDIVEATYIPGELWPVNVHAVMHVADLFAVNERIVVTIRARAGGTIVVVLVGATMVGTTRVAFDDLHTNARRREVQRRTYDPPVPVRAGGPLGHFEFGSTVIVVCSRQVGALDPLTEGESVRMGQRMGRLGAAVPGGD
ncbi:MAG TPA: archaetidylserine decarboxylase [Gemmatimonadaceae bacterium]|nr:archaetidylserine decarboxylase [Gemmatimonadaceae bacterium]